LSESNESEFNAWLKDDSLHIAAWSRFHRLWRQVGVVRDHPKILTIRKSARLSTKRCRAVRCNWRAGLAFAVSIVAAILVREHLPTSVSPFAHPTLAPSVSSAAPSAALIRDASTKIGERSVLVLLDGSRVTLNTFSAVRVNYSGHDRRVTLVRGEAYFDVAKDATRPFIVSAGSREVIAVGTSFDVRLQDRQVKVTLVEGKVRITHAADRAQPDAGIRLDAGSALTASEDCADRIERLDTARSTSWRHGMLLFEGENLADVVAELNRYSLQKLQIADPALEGRKVSGVFEPTSGLALANALEAYGIARKSQQTATAIVLESPR